MIQVALAGVKLVFKRFFEDISFRSGGVRETMLPTDFKLGIRTQNLMNATDSILGRPLEIGGVMYKNANLAGAGYVEFMKFQLAYQILQL